MELVKPNTNSLRLYRIKLFEPTILSAGKPKGNKETFRILDNEGYKITDLEGNKITYK